MTTPTEAIVCRSYTGARRHPLVVGKIGGWALPTPLTPVQLVVLVGSFIALLWTRGAWAHLGGVGNLLVQGFVPLTLAWTVRHLRVEGRPPLRALGGFVSYLGAPRAGTLRGRAWREPRPVLLRGARLFVLDRPGD